MMRCCGELLVVFVFSVIGSQVMAEEKTNAICKINFDGVSVIEGGCYIEFDDGYTMIFSPVTNLNGDFKYQHFIRIENGEAGGFVNYNGGGGWDHAQVELGEFLIVNDNEQGMGCFKGDRGEICFKQQ